MPETMDAEELAKKLGFSAKRIREAARLGQIPAIKLGRLVRFYPEEVVAALRKKHSRRSPAPASPTSSPSS